MNDKNIYIQLLVIIFFTLPLWLIVYYEIKNKIRTNNNLKRIHERNKRIKNNSYNTWNNKTRYYIKDIKVNHLDYLIKLYK